MSGERTASPLLSVDGANAVEPIALAAEMKSVPRAGGGNASSSTGTVFPDSTKKAAESGDPASDAKKKKNARKRRSPLDGFPPAFFADAYRRPDSPMRKTLLLSAPPRTPEKIEEPARVPAPDEADDSADGNAAFSALSASGDAMSASLATTVVSVRRPFSAFAAGGPVAAADDAADTLVYDGGVNAPWSYPYNWGLGYIVFRQWMFGSQSFSNDGSEHCVFRADCAGTVVIAGDVEPASVTIESGDYVFDQKTNGILLFGGCIVGAGTLAVERGASLSLNEKNTYSGDTFARGKIRTEADGALGAGAIRIEAGGMLDAGGNALDNSEIFVAGTLLLDEKIPDGEYRPLAKSDAVATLAPSGRLELGGNVVRGNFVLNGGTLAGDAGSSLGGNVSVSVGDGNALSVSGAALTAASAEFSGGSRLVVADGANVAFSSLKIDLRGASAPDGNAAFAEIDASSGEALPKLSVGELSLLADDAEIAALVERDGEASIRFVSVAGLPDGASLSDCVAANFASVKINDGDKWRGIYDAESGCILIAAVPEPCAVASLFGLCAAVFAAARRRRRGCARVLFLKKN